MILKVLRENLFDLSPKQEKTKIFVRDFLDFLGRDYNYKTAYISAQKTDRNARPTVDVSLSDNEGNSISMPGISGKNYKNKNEQYQKFFFAINNLIDDNSWNGISIEVSRGGKFRMNVTEGGRKAPDFSHGDIRHI